MFHQPHTHKYCLPLSTRLYCTRNPKPRLTIPGWSWGMSTAEYIRQFDGLNNLKGCSYAHA